MSRSQSDQPSFRQVSLDARIHQQIMRLAATRSVREGRKISMRTIIEEALLEKYPSMRHLS